MTAAEREVLIAAASTAYRARDPDGRVLGHPAFYDLDAEGRAALFDEVLAARALEAGTDPGELSTTARSVLSRITAPR